MKDELLTIGPAAKRAGISPGWLRKLADDEEKAPGTGIACTRVGTLRLFRVTDLERYKAKRKK